MIASAYQEFPGNQLALEHDDDGSEIRVITETTTFKKVKWLFNLLDLQWSKQYQKDKRGLWFEVHNLPNCWNAKSSWNQIKALTMLFTIINMITHTIYYESRIFS